MKRSEITHGRNRGRRCPRKRPGVGPARGVIVAERRKRRNRSPCRRPPTRARSRSRSSSSRRARTARDARNPRTARPTRSRSRPRAGCIRSSSTPRRYRARRSALARKISARASSRVIASKSPIVSWYSSKPARCWTISRRVMSALSSGTSGKISASVLSSATVPSSVSRKIAVAVRLFRIDPTSKAVSGVLGVSFSRSARPWASLVSGSPLAVTRIAPEKPFVTASSIRSRTAAGTSGSLDFPDLLAHPSIRRGRRGRSRCRGLRERSWIGLLGCDRYMGARRYFRVEISAPRSFSARRKSAPRRCAGRIARSRGERRPRAVAPRTRARAGTRP